MSAVRPTVANTWALPADLEIGPSGYQVREDEHMVYLFRDGEHVPGAVWSAGIRAEDLKVELDRIVVRDRFVRQESGPERGNQEETSPGG